MKAHQVSKESSLRLKDKLKELDAYSIGDLLYVVREYEDCPRRFEDEVIKKVALMLFDKGIICM